MAGFGGCGEEGSRSTRSTRFRGEPTPSCRRPSKARCWPRPINSSSTSVSTTTPGPCWRSISTGPAARSALRGRHLRLLRHGVQLGRPAARSRRRAGRCARTTRPANLTARRPRFRRNPVPCRQLGRSATLRAVSARWIGVALDQLSGPSDASSSCVLSSEALRVAASSPMGTTRTARSVTPASR